MRTSTLLIAVLALSLWVAPAHAQHEAEIGTNVHEALVTVTLQSQIVKPGDRLELPSAIMERLIGQQPLTQLDVETDGGRETRLRAQFTFSSTDELTEWYESEAAQELIQMLNEGQNSATLALHIERKRL